MTRCFSIIIPTLNSAASLSVTLESILNQKFIDFEILIMDGLSTDKTYEIAKSYKDDRIHIFSENDCGIYDAMNKGIKLAEGDWIYFLGSDDKMFNSDVLMQIYNEISKNNYDVIYGNVFSTRFDGRYDGEFDYLKIISQNICHQSIFFKRTIFRLTGLFNLRYKSHADWDHNLKWFLNPKVRKYYININIAEYGDGGYSSIYPDELFALEKNIRVIKYGFFTLPFSVLNNVTREEYIKAFLSKKFARGILLKIINLYARLCLKYNLNS